MTDALAPRLSREEAVTRAYLLEAEVAELLRVHIKVVRRERAAGRLGWHRIGGQVRISRDDLTCYLESQWHGPAEDRTSSAAPASGTSPGPTALAALRGPARGRAIAQRLSRP